MVWSGVGAGLNGVVRCWSLLGDYLGSLRRPRERSPDITSCWRHMRRLCIQLGSPCPLHCLFSQPSTPPHMTTVPEGCLAV